MNIAPIADVKARFSAYIKKTLQGPVVVTKNGRPVVVMLSVKDEVELERILLAHSRKFQAMLDAAEQRIKDTGGIEHDDLWNMLEAEPQPVAEK
jgi:prevent-host-death family protein